MRLIISGGASGEEQMAMDESMLILLSNGLLEPTVRIWNFLPTTLSIGRFLAYEDWVDEGKRLELSIPVVRRFTGGGPALHDEKGEITWTIVGNFSMTEGYEIAGKSIVNAARELGVSATFTPINDVEAEGKKICGMAGATRRRATLIHGTFMFNTDLSMLSVIRLPSAKESVRGRPSSRVTTISLLLGRRVSREEALTAIINGFSWLGLKEGNTTQIERDLAKELSFKYGNEKWTKIR